MREKILVSWSGGKDAALALSEIKEKHYNILALITTITKDYDRASMHGVRSILIEKQAVNLEIPLEKIYISAKTTNEEYDSIMENLLLKYIDKGISSVVFGDIFLVDVKKYREENLAKINLKAIFPLWKKDTSKLAHSFIKSGYKAIITCVDSKFLDKSFTGRMYDEKFLFDLPSNVDPCGENGEFHSFVFEGPIFKEKIKFKQGDIVLRDERFYFCDLIPV